MENIVHNRDCMEGMREIPDKYFQLALVDISSPLRFTGVSANKIRQILDGYDIIFEIEF